MSSQFNYDAFLSHSSKDKVVVCAVTERPMDSFILIPVERRVRAHTKDQLLWSATESSLPTGEENNHS